MNTSCFKYHCHCPNKSQAHYKDRKSQSNSVQCCPLIPNHPQHISIHLDGLYIQVAYEARALPQDHLGK